MNASEAIARMSTAANLTSSKHSSNNCESWRGVCGSPEPSIKSKRSFRDLRPQLNRALSFLSTASSVASSPHEEPTLSEEDLLDPENRAWM